MFKAPPDDSARLKKERPEVYLLLKELSMMGEINYGPITSGMKEWEFYREGMSIEEYERERECLGEHFDEWLNRTYVPLWKQKQEKN